MNKYLLLVYHPDFFKATNEYLETLYMYAMQSGKIPLEKDEFKSIIRTLLKQYWTHQRANLPDNLELIIPPELREPTLQTVMKEARGEFPLDNNETVPMFNYAGKLTHAGSIPHIFGVLSKSQTVLYNNKGETPKTNPHTDLMDILKGFEEGFNKN